MKYIKVTWKEFDKMIDDLVKQIKESKVEFKYIYGTPRGGLIPAVCLSHRLGIPHITSLQDIDIFSHILFVDDISDTGKTLKDFNDNWIATLYSTPWTISIPDFCVKEKTDKNSWIVFPWEDSKNESKKN